MRIALIHDQLVNYGGAEGLFLTLTRMYPKADIFTSFFDKKEPLFHQIQNRIVQSIRLPLGMRYSTVGKLIVNAYWQSLDLSRYELVITLSDTLSCHSIITGPDTIHIAYILTPPKYLYVEEPNYYVIGKFSIIRNIVVGYLRNCDQVSSQRPDVIVVPSITVKKRVSKYYRRQSFVIPCPIPNTKTAKRKLSQEFYLLFGRVETHKGVELVIKSFTKFKKKLLVVGVGKEFKRLSSKYKSYRNIQFLGWVSAETKLTLFAQAKALINASLDEDFGVTVVEALKQGVPVIAYYSGSMKEIIKDGINGLHFYEYSSDALIKTIGDLEKKPLLYKNIVNSSKKYSEKTFITSFYSLVAKHQR